MPSCRLPACCDRPGTPTGIGGSCGGPSEGLFETELVLLAAVSGAAVVATRSHGWFADRADFAVAIAAAVFVYYQLVMVAGLNDVLRHASVMPYYRQRIGDINVHSSGEGLARHIDELDAVARATL